MPGPGSLHLQRPSLPFPTPSPCCCEEHTAWTSRWKLEGQALGDQVNNEPDLPGLGPLHLPLLNYCVFQGDVFS